jgi:hypothetical protein
MILPSILRRLLGRPVMPPVTHTLVCGASRSGKSEAELSRLVPLASSGQCAIVVMDPPGKLAQKLLLHLHALSLADRVVYDRLADTDLVPGYAWLTPSAHPDPLQREAENEERTREFTAVLLRRRHIQDSALTPLIEEGVLSALRLYLAQRSPCPLPWVADAFDLGSASRAHLLANCTEPQLVRKFHQYAALSPTARRTETGPAERVLRAVLTSPAFRVRSGTATLDLKSFLDARGILILDGSSHGNLSRDAAAVMMGAVILRVIQHCRTGPKSRVVLVLDEAVNAGLVGIHESQALSEAGKWGLEFHVLVQNPFSFASAEITGNVLQNCWRHEWFRQGSPEAAHLAAQDIGTPILDPLKVHHTETRIRTADAGFRRIPVISRSQRIDSQGRERRSRTWSTVLWSRRREVADRQPRFTALTDQILLIQKELMLLKPGYRFVRCDRITPIPEYVPMLRDPIPASDQPGCPIGRRTAGPPAAEGMLHSILEGMKRCPVFRSPAVPTVASPSSLAHRGAAQTLARRAEAHAQAGDDSSSSAGTPS